MIQVEVLKILEDNYAFIIHNKKEALILDPGVSEAFIKKIVELKVKPTAILNTHHHWDHTDGNLKLKEAFKVPLYAPIDSQNRIQGVDFFISKNTTQSIGEFHFQVHDLSAHTMPQLAFYFQEAQSFFVGDALFNLGCGKLFEGSYEDLLQTMQKILSFPNETKLYFSHNYLKTNLDFSKKYWPENSYLNEYEKEYSLGQSTPVLLADERKANLLLNFEHAELREKYSLKSSLDFVKFFRQKRDGFRS